MEEIFAPPEEKKLPTPEEKLLRSPTFWEKYGKLLLLILPILIILILIPVFISTYKTPPQPALPTQPLPTSLPTPTTDPTANWKTYTNAQWGLSFKYPETWFPQEAPQSSQQGDAVNFYPNGVTPDPGGGGETPYNFVFTVENQDWHDPQTNEQFISEARQIDGNRVLDVAGKPAIREGATKGNTAGPDWDITYVIKLSDTGQLLFIPYTKDVAEKLDTIVSTIKFTQ